MNNGTIEADFKQLKASPKQQAPSAVNMDEVNRETIHVTVLLYKDEPLFDEEGNPFCDESGTQYAGRVLSGSRIAKIKNIVPTDAYHEAIEISNGFNGGMPNKEQLDQMTDMVLGCWQISEPFMTKKALREGVNGEHIMALFMRFFNQENHPLNANPSQDGSITQDKG